MKLVGENNARMGLAAVLAVALDLGACNTSAPSDARSGTSTTGEGAAAHGGGGGADSPAASGAAPGAPRAAPSSSTPARGAGASGPAGSSGVGASAPGASSSSASSSTPEAARLSCAARWQLGQTLSLAPAAAGQRYVRCGTAGLERPWEVTLSPDGSRLAARTAAGTVRLYAVGAGWRELAQLAAPVGQISAVAFSPDGSRLVTLEEEMGETTVWTAADGALERSLAGPPPSTIDGGARAIAFSSDGARVATGFGTVLGLPSGAAIDWTTGQPVTFERRANPAVLAPGGAVIANLRFGAGDARLFVDARSQTGNSPPSAELTLFDLGGGAPRSLYPRMFARALAGYALSRDGALVAVAATDEAAVAGAPVGLHLYRTSTGEEIAADGGFAGTVLAFSADGTRLYVTGGPAGDGISALDTATLQPAERLSAPARARLLGVSPDGLIVVVAGGRTSWIDPDGYVIRSVGYALTQVSWTRDGALGAGAASDGALFHLWRESDGTELCAPSPAPTPQANVTLLPTAPEPLRSNDGAVGARSELLVHAHAQDWFGLRLTAADGGEAVRVFGAAGGQPQRAAFSDGAARFYTEVVPNSADGSPIAIWCR